MTFAKTLFLKKVTFTGTGGYHFNFPFLEGVIPPTAETPSNAFLFTSVRDPRYFLLESRVRLMVETPTKSLSHQTLRLPLQPLLTPEVSCMLLSEAPQCSSLGGAGGQGVEAVGCGKWCHKMAPHAPQPWCCLRSLCPVLWGHINWKVNSKVL